MPTNKEIMLSGLALLRGPDEQPIHIIDGKLSARPMYLATTAANGRRLPLLKLRNDAENLDFPGQKTTPLQNVSYERFVWVGTTQCLLLTQDKWTEDNMEVERAKGIALDAVLCWLGYEEDTLKQIS
jgi:hypothetical protein